MLIYKSLTLDNYVLFDHAEIDLDYQGLTIIGGWNKNAGKNKSNGAGKSLLTSAIPTFWYGSGPAIVTAKSRARRDAFYRKGASLSLNFTDRVDYSATKYLSGRSLKYNIIEDKKDLEFTTASAAEEYLSNISLTEEQFYSTVYLDSRRPAFTMLGQGAQRFNFFCNLFSFDDFDETKSRLEAFRLTVRDDKVRLEELEKQIAELNKEAKRLTKEINGRDKKWIIEQFEKINKWQDRRALLENLNTYSKFKKPSVEYSKGFHEQYKEQVKELEKRFILYNEYMKWAKKIDKIKKEYDSLPKVKNPEKEFKKFHGKLLNVRKLESERKILSEESKKISSKIDMLYSNRNSPYTLDELKDQRKKIKKDLEWSERQVSLLQNARVSNNKCPLCGGRVSSKHIQQELKKYKKQYKECIKFLDDLKPKIEQAEQEIKYKKKINSIDKKMPKDKSKEKEELEKKVHNLSRLIDLKNKIENIPVNKVDKDPKQKLEKVRGKLKDMEYAKEYKDLQTKLKDNSIKDLKDLKKQLKDLPKSKINGWANTVAWVEEWIAQLQKIKKKLAKLKETSSSVQKKLSRSKLLDAMIDAYGNQGLKRIACAEIANRVEENINKVSNLIFSENYKFRFEVTKTDFGIYFEDKRGSFDIRNLSGAESRSFTVLSMLAILPLLPSSMRSNLLILDEIDANLDYPALEKFRNNLVPALTEIIPHVIVVTPFADNYADGRHITVIKKGNKSELRYG